MDVGIDVGGIGVGVGAVVVVDSDDILQWG